MMRKIYSAAGVLQVGPGNSAKKVTFFYTQEEYSQKLYDHNTKNLIYIIRLMDMRKCSAQRAVSDMPED